MKSLVSFFSAVRKLKSRDMHFPVKQPPKTTKKGFKIKEEIKHIVGC